MLLVIIQIVAGLTVLVAGGEFLVRGAVRLAASFKISPLVIGLTVVAFGTSAPELGVSLQAAWSGKPDVAVGNVVGSNIINVLLVLGASALVAPLLVSSQLIRLDVPLMVTASVVMWLISLDGSISRIEGVLLFVTLVTYIVFCIRKSRSENIAVQNEFAEEYGPPPSGKRFLATNFGLIIAGLIGLGLGSNWLVGGAVTIATWLGVSELVIGLTVVATGTSLPEVVTSVVASYRGERDIAVGNVVGSNLFNILCVLGLTAIFSLSGVAVSPAAIQFDMPVMIAVSVICLPIFISGSMIRRYEGALFLIYYLAYTTFLVFAATQPESTEWLGRALLWGVIPLTVLTLLGSFYHSRRERLNAVEDDGA